MLVSLIDALPYTSSLKPHFKAQVKVALLKTLSLDCATKIGERRSVSVVSAIRGDYGCSQCVAGGKARCIGWH